MADAPQMAQTRKTTLKNEGEKTKKIAEKTKDFVKNLVKAGGKKCAGQDREQEKKEKAKTEPTHKNKDEKPNQFSSSLSQYENENTPETQRQHIHNNIMQSITDSNANLRIDNIKELASTYSEAAWVFLKEVAKDTKFMGEYANRHFMMWQTAKVIGKSNFKEAADELNKLLPKETDDKLIPKEINELKGRLLNFMQENLQKKGIEGSLSFENSVLTHSLLSRAENIPPQEFSPKSGMMPASQSLETSAVIQVPQFSEVYLSRQESASPLQNPSDSVSLELVAKIREEMARKMREEKAKTAQPKKNLEPHAREQETKPPKRTVELQSAAIQRQIPLIADKAEFEKTIIELYRKFSTPSKIGKSRQSKSGIKVAKSEFEMPKREEKGERQKTAEKKTRLAEKKQPKKWHAKKAEEPKTEKSKKEKTKSETRAKIPKKEEKPAEKPKKEEKTAEKKESQRQKEKTAQKMEKKTIQEKNQVEKPKKQETAKKKQEEKTARKQEERQGEKHSKKAQKERMQAKTKAEKSEGKKRRERDEKKAGKQKEKQTSQKKKEEKAKEKQALQGEKGQSKKQAKEKKQSEKGQAEKEKTQAGAKASKSKREKGLAQAKPKKPAKKRVRKEEGEKAKKHTAKEEPSKNQKKGKHEKKARRGKEIQGKGKTLSKKGQNPSQFRKNAQISLSFLIFPCLILHGVV